VIGPAGQKIRELFTSEQVTIQEYEIRQPGYAAEHLEDILYDEQEVKRINIWEEGRHAADVGPDDQRNPYQGTENAEHWDRGFEAGIQNQNRSVERRGAL
jgi:hypothetical protein